MALIGSWTLDFMKSSFPAVPTDIRSPEIAQLEDNGTEANMKDPAAQPKVLLFCSVVVLLECMV